jgi:hypothetical protein
VGGMVMDSIVDFFRRLFCKHQWEVYGRNLSDGIINRLGVNAEPKERIRVCKKCHEVQTVIIKGN